MASGFSTSRRKPPTLALAGLAAIGMVSAATAQTSDSPSPAAIANPIVPGAPKIKNYAPGTLIIPDSNRLLATDTKRMRTHLRIIVLPKPSSVNTGGNAPGGVTKSYAPPVSGNLYETPASIQCVYGLVTPVVGCNPNTVTAHLSSGGSKAIGIVDAYHYPNAQTDLAVFSTQFGLPAPTASNFAVANTGSTPPDGTGSGWDVEAALDIQWAHAMAPGAFIYLVEAQSNSDADLNAAVDKASQLVSAKGGGQISMSYGRGESSGDPSLNSHFATSGIVYFASSGDAPGVEFPCASPNVVCVGGTSISRNLTNGRFQGEIAWSDSGGGVSVYQARPTFQSRIAAIVGAKRGVPDIAAVADPYTGAYVYNASNGGWLAIGGTSLASPLMAGYVNHTGAFNTSSASENQIIYNTLGSPSAGWTDIVSGACNFSRASIAGSGWDACTGRGSPFGVAYKSVKPTPVN